MLHRHAMRITFQNKGHTFKFMKVSRNRRTLYEGKNQRTEMPNQANPTKRKHITVESETIAEEKESEKSVPIIDSNKQDYYPPNWEIVYNNILEMRKDLSAPVDTMGCEKAHDRNAYPKVQRFQCR